MKRRRIAIASRDVSGVTGTTTTILEHARRLCADGWEVHVFGEKLDAGRIAAAGAEAHFITRWRIAGAFKRRLFAWLFERELRADRPFDLVWGHGDTLIQDVLSLHNCVHAAHQMAHGKPLPARSPVGRVHARILSERRFKLLIANSKLMKDEVSARFGVPPESMTVIHPGYDPGRFRPEDRESLGTELRRRLGLGTGDILIGLITSGDFSKRGVAMFLRGLALLPPESKRRVRALVVGKEERLEPYRALARDSGLGERISFLPPDPEVNRYYHALDVYVHPALYEEFGQSVQEAMACGVPVVTSRRVGACELLQGEARDTLMPEPSEAALARELERLIKDPGLRERRAEQGIAACRANTWDHNFRLTLASLEKLLP